MKEPIELTGITWDHSRALPPLVAAAQRYEELNPGIRIRWEKRSLHEFGHMPIDVLADRFDLIIIDHPWAGFCFARDLILDLMPLIQKAGGPDAGDFVGRAFSSYTYEGKQLALPVDVATPVPSWRQDLMEKAGAPIPATWKDLVDLADRRLLAMPGFNADLFLNWSMLLRALAADPYNSPETIADPDRAHEAMGRLKRLAEPQASRIYETNPIRLAEWMTQTDEVAYNPFAYSYVNYARPSYVEKPLKFGNLVSLEDGTPLRSILGGTGYAITRGCRHVESAFAFGQFCSGAFIQNGIYRYAGGQPAHRTAWEGTSEDSIFDGNFFADTRHSHQEALVRPRYHGYVPLQETIGICLQRYCRGEKNEADTWDLINDLYRQSLPAEESPIL